jgi:hypothetical protein
MAIKAVLDNLDDVQEPMKALYVKDERTNKFYLDVDPESVKAHPVTAPLENAFRAAKSRLAEYKQAFGGSDENIAKAAELLKMAEEDAEKTLMKSGDVNAIIAAKVKPWQDKHTETERAYHALRQEVEEQRLRDWLQTCVKGKVLDTATEDAYLRLRGQFRVADGIICAIDETQPDASKALLQLVKDLETKAPHLFPQSAGPNVRGGKTVVPEDFGSLSPAERINRARRQA